MAAAAFAFFASAFAAYRKPISNEVNNQRKRRECTFSSSSFFFASSSAFFFSSSSCAFEGAAGTPPLFFFFASLTSFSSCLIRLIRGSRLSVKSTSVRRRAVSSFFLLARSVLFFFSVYRLSSRLHNSSDQSGRWRGERDVLVTTLVDFFIKVFETSPTIKVVPKIVKALHLHFPIFINAKHRYRCFLAKPCLTFKHRPECRKKLVRIELFLFASFGWLEVRLFRLVVLEFFKVRVDRVKLTTAFGIGEDFVGFLDTFKETVVVRGVVC